MKRLMHEKMKEIDDLMKKEHPDTEKYKAVLEKGLSNLEKRKKIAVMVQNVLRVSHAGIVSRKEKKFFLKNCCTYKSVTSQGMILACKINWMDDPKLRDIAMTLEELPISD